MSEDDADWATIQFPHLNGVFFRIALILAVIFALHDNNVQIPDVDLFFCANLLGSIALYLVFFVYVEGFIILGYSTRLLVALLSWSNGDHSPPNCPPGPRETIYEIIKSEVHCVILQAIVGSIILFIIELSALLIYALHDLAKKLDNFGLVASG
jgi:hypothetical protein